MSRIQRVLLLPLAAIGLAALVAALLKTPAVAQAVRAALVRDADNGALQPVHFRINCLSDTSVGELPSTCSVAGPTVPAGKRLVVEQVSVFCVLRKNQNLQQVWLYGNAAEPSNHYILIGPATTEKAVGNDEAFPVVYSYTRSVKAYFDPGEPLGIFATKQLTEAGAPVTGIASERIRVYVEGYYVTL